MERNEEKTEGVGKRILERVPDGKREGDIK